jgi:hypothetical protein
MLDFKELPQDGEAFEQLIRELLFSYGMTVERSGRGPMEGAILSVVNRSRALLLQRTGPGSFSASTLRMQIAAWELMTSTILSTRALTTMPRATRSPARRNPLRPS